MVSIRERNGKFNVIYSYTNEKGERIDTSGSARISTSK